MVCSKVLVIEDYGDPVGAGFIPAEVASPSALQRFRRTIQTDHWCFHVYSLIRSAVLRQFPEFARRLMKAGESLRYEPLAVVYHVLPLGLSKEFFLSR
jgi:hypothetical protein